MAGRRGFTLLEVVVVLIIVGLGTALVAPSLVPPEEQPATLSTVLAHARDVAARRAEVVVLKLDDDGRWDVRAEASTSEGPIASGRVEEGSRGPPLRLRVSPQGSCGPSLGFEPVADGVGLDLLTCSIGR